MSAIRAHLAGRLRSASLSTVPPRPESQDYSADLARHAASILFQSPIPSKENRPVYILNAAALPDSREENFDSLLPYVLARLPEEDELVKGFEYEVVFFAGDSDGSVTTKKTRPGWGWFLQAYHILSRAMRKRLQKLYIVHEKAWVRILAEVFSTIVSPKFRRKIIHASTLSNLALHIPIEDLLILPSTYLYDRRVSDDIFAPYASGRRAFAAQQPLPTASNGKIRLPRVLRETSAFLLMENNVEQEGLFRVPPHSKLRDVLKEAYDRGQKYIVWKDNGDTLPLPPYPHAENQNEIIAELDPRDSYSVFMAAALIKLWYASLSQPIFTPGSYRDLKRLYGDPDDLPGLERLTELLSPTSEWSILPPVSREILIKHMLPLMSTVSAHEDKNKMSPENLAVCIAPALLHGPDQLEDAKMSSIVRRIMTEAIELWSEGLRESCGQTEAAFKELLELPHDEVDWEDPLEVKRADEDRKSWDESQSTGIIMQDNEGLIYNDDPSSPPPALPPRAAMTSGRASGDAITKRKPAPPLTVPPRYSALASDSPVEATGSPLTHAATTDGFAPQEGQSASGDSKVAPAPDDKKSGTNFVDSSAPPAIILPKRKALTTDQINNADLATDLVDTRKASVELSAEAEASQAPPVELRGRALPGLANLKIVKRPAPPPVKRKALREGTYTADQKVSPRATSSNTSPTIISPISASDLRRPSLPASANHAPTFTSLARPVHPTTNSTANRPPSKSTSLPGPRKLRAPSAALLQRMPSLKALDKEATLAPPPSPQKLNLKRKSVDDLRRLYEERASTASALVEAGKRK
ncbi:hypothetical protein P280DRAFT_462321 [Massarina eburnea CBS 473.64]|uniref:Rho GTPase activation protein n=1 Tax=Massarina eburnea CBS 473.64 TaxID=1395130 RepID=A0A6A6RJ32_9PLEO|nr:hypothetical protein P280DRAFT_462321 [Massarina eburnea CBS 473.64]